MFLRPTECGKRSEKNRTCPPITEKRSSRSDRRDARKFYDLAPLLGFVGEESGKIGRRARERRGAKLSEPRTRLGIGEHRVHCLVDLVDGLGGRAFRRT